MVSNEKYLKNYHTGRNICMASKEDLEQSKESFRSGEFAGQSPACSEYALFVKRIDGRDVLCYVE